MRNRLSRHWLLQGWLCATTVLVWSGRAAWVDAHHSLAGVYDSSKQVKVEGDVARFHFVNPHPYLTVTVKGANGKSADWRLEMDNRFELEAIGMTSASFSRGDRIIASGSRGHGDANSLYIRRLDRAVDGFWYEQIGSTPSVGRRPLHVISGIPRVGRAFHLRPGSGGQVSPGKTPIRASAPAHRPPRW